MPRLSDAIERFVYECQALGFEVRGVAFLEGDKVISALNLETFDSEGKEVVPNYQGIEIREEL